MNTNSNTKPRGGNGLNNEVRYVMQQLASRLDLQTYKPKIYQKDQLMQKTFKAQCYCSQNTNEVFNDVFLQARDEVGRRRPRKGEES